MQLSILMDSDNENSNSKNDDTKMNNYENSNQDDEDIIEIIPTETSQDSMIAEKNKSNNNYSINNSNSRRHTSTASTTNSVSDAEQTSQSYSPKQNNVKMSSSKNNADNVVPSPGSSSSSSTIVSESSNDGSDEYSSKQNNENSKIKIGQEHQVDLAEYYCRNLNRNERFQPMENLVWAPCSKLSDTELEDYLNEASIKYSYNIEQSLALLFWNEYNLEKTLEDVKLYIPVRTEWSNEDKIIFEQAYNFHGKNFSKIRLLLPDKTHADLVNYYYMWKKIRNYQSSMDYQQNNTKNISASINSNSLNNGLDLNGIEIINSLRNGTNNKENLNDLSGSDDSSENESHENFDTNICCNCDLITSELSSTPKGMLCNPCYDYWKETGGLMRPDTLFNKENKVFHQKKNRFINDNANEQIAKQISNQEQAKNFHKTLRKPPKGIFLNKEELINLAESDNNNNDKEQVFEMLNRQLLCLRNQVQKNKQEICTLIGKISNENELKVSLDNEMLQIEAESIPIPGWTPDEIGLVIQGFSKYGEDFEAISQVICSKTESSIRAFYNYYKDNLNLDKLILSSPKELKSKSNQIYNTLNMLNLPELQVDSATISIETEECQKINNLDKIDSNDVEKTNMNSFINDCDDVIFITND